MAGARRAVDKYPKPVLQPSLMRLDAFNVLWNKKPPEEDHSTQSCHGRYSRLAVVVSHFCLTCCSVLFAFAP